jgi:hypothetical protein
MSTRHRRDFDPEFARSLRENLRISANMTAGRDPEEPDPDLILNTPEGLKAGTGAPESLHVTVPERKTEYGPDASKPSLAFEVGDTVRFEHGYRAPLTGKIQAFVRDGPGPRNVRARVVSITAPARGRVFMVALTQLSPAPNPHSGPADYRGTARGSASASSTQYTGDDPLPLTEDIDGYTPGDSDDYSTDPVSRMAEYLRRGAP